MEETIDENNTFKNEAIKYNKLEKLRKQIESLEKIHHVEIAKILKVNNAKANDCILVGDKISDIQAAASAGGGATQGFALAMAVAL